MWLFGLVAPAHATAMTLCGVSLLPDGPGTRVLITCQGSSAAPGGPVSRFPGPVPDVSLSLGLRSVEVASFERAETRADGAAVYTTDHELSAGLPYVVYGPEPVGSQFVTWDPTPRR